MIAERLFYLHRATIHVGEFLKGLANLIKRRNFAEALARIRRDAWTGGTRDPRRDYPP